MIWARLRIGSGLILALFVTLHLLNHTLGLVSVDLMERVRLLNALLWQNWAGTVALYGALLVHLFVALRTLYIRRTLRLSAWELSQLALGLSIPILVAAHVLGTRGTQELLGFDVGYPLVLTILWSNEWNTIRQLLLVAAVWLHLCLGLHYWWRNQAWYSAALPWLYGAALLLPVLSALGFARGGMDMLAAISADPGLRAELFEGWRAAPRDVRDHLVAISEWLPWAYGGLLALVLAARWWRRRGERRVAQVRIEHPERPVSARVGQTVLEALRAAGVPHASTCGGRARCTTCRVRVPPGTKGLPAPGDLEATALTRIGAPANVRLACQLRPVENLTISPLVAVKGAAERYRPGGVYGQERQVVAMFVDLRGSTGLNEARLPYDVVFILNQFFAEMSAALEETDGHYAQFAGDGLMALYGLRTGLEAACVQALRGAQAMERRLASLNERLGEELPEPLRIGIGIHSGEAIVGTMGPPTSPNLSAIGDNINIAARLEGLTKNYGVTVVVSAETVRGAGITDAPWPVHQAPVRGRAQDVSVYAVGSAAEFALT